MGEIWKPVVGYEGLYAVSSFGNVASLNYHGTGKRRILKPRPSANGYYFVQVFKNKIGKMVPIHRLVATAFVDNPNGYNVINHIDENKHNNMADNLEWCTHKYNVNYSLKKRRGKKITKRIRPVSQISKDGDVIKVWDNLIQIKTSLNYSDWSIQMCCEGKRKTAYGFIWQYAN